MSKAITYIINTEDVTIGVGTSAGYVCVIPALFPNEQYKIDRVQWSFKCRSLLGVVMPKEINESIQAQIEIYNGNGVLPPANETPLCSTPEPRVNFPPAPDNILRLFEPGRFEFNRVTFKNYISIYLRAENYGAFDAWFMASIIIDISKDE